MKVLAYPLGLYESICYVLILGDEGIIIDPGVDYQLLPIDNIKIKGIFCTHGHYDHIAYSEDIIAGTGAPIYCHREELVTLQDPAKNQSSYIAQPYRIEGDVTLLEDNQIVTSKDLGFTGSETFSLTVIHTPGHTRGSVCFLVNGSDQENYLFSGDMLFAGTIGRTDLGGNKDDMTSSLKRLALLPDNLTVFPGHGPATTLGVEKLTNPYFTALN